ncbi:MAG: beta-galactosidase [Acidobacteriota bacterium]
MTRLRFCAFLLAGHAAFGAGSLVLEDFETPAAVKRWEGPIELSTERASHGRQAAKVRLTRGRAEVASAQLPGDWTGYDRLLFDIYSDRKVSTATLRIYDDTQDYFEGEDKILLIRGWNHIEVKLTPLKASSYLRDISLARIRRVQLSFGGRAREPWTVYLDNFRLAAGEETPAMASRTEPQDAVVSIDNRWVTVRQVARPGDVPESPAVARLRETAREEVKRLESTIAGARMQGIETIYAERSLVVADLGLNVRPLLAWFNNDADKQSMFAYVAASCRRARQELEDSLMGTGPRRELDDTQVPEPLVPPLPALKGRPVKGSFFLDDRGDPLMILSLHSPSEALQRFFATPLQHIESYSVGGGSRWTIERSPVYAAFQEDPDTHRVGWDGWCGHLIRDLYSMGGTKKENVVICLESPRIRKAVAEYIRLNTPKFHANPQLLYDIMAYELMYICYCERSQQSFREWLANKHGTVARANECWGTSYEDFAQVAAPPVKDSRPLAGTNRGLWYDWARFNQDRFTDYLLWVRGEIRKIDAFVPLAAGGSSSMLAGRTGTTGIDEERIVNEVDDVIIHEGGGSTLGVDLQLAFSDEKKPLADPEMSLESTADLLPHFLHGKSVAQLYHWPSEPANEFHSNTGASLAHSWRHSLADIDELLRAALDVRRLNREIAALADAPAEVAILYSKTATLQLPPEMLTWYATPYLAELHKTYEAARYLDAKPTFVTERQALKGRLSRYKLLVVPAVRNLPSEVVEAIFDYASAGGRVLVVPESLLGDEYNRPRRYLERLGIAVKQTMRPEPSSTGAMVQGYDQSFSQSVEMREVKPEKLRPSGALSTGELVTGGVRQSIALTGGGATPVFSYSDGSPAIVRTPTGRGTIWYSAASLDERSYARLLDALYSEAGVTRPARIRGAAGKVEARYATLGDRRLLYVINFDDRPTTLTVELDGKPVHTLRELRSQTENAIPLHLAARETRIFEIGR